MVLISSHGFVLAHSVLASSVVRETAQKAAQNEGPTSDWLFPSRSGGPLRKSDFLHREFKRAIQRAGLPEIHFHRQRHTAGIVEEMLGHSTVTMTLYTYSRVTPSLQRGAARAIDDLLGPRMAAERLQ